MKRARLYAVFVVFAATGGSMPGVATAQVGVGQGILFGTPSGSFAIRGGWAQASARSDIFGFTTERLTLDRSAFSSPALDLDAAFRLGAKTDLVFSASVSGTRRRSEFRNFVDNNDMPIEQRTEFERIPITVSVKQYLLSRGRSVGQLAWIPARFAPYVGAGAAAMWYQFRQNGDFIDFQTSDVFEGLFETRGWTPAATGLAGMELSISPRLAIVAESRYIWAKGKPGADFSRFERIDLSGLSTTAGISVRF